MADTATEIGRVIGQIAKTQSSIQENLSPDEADALLTSFSTEQVVMQGSLTATKRVLTGVLTVGHPIYGEVQKYPVFVPMILGHPTWGVLGKAYLPSPTSALKFPLTFPLEFEDTYTTFSRTPLFTIDF